MSTPLIPAAVIYCPALNETEPAKVIDDVARRLARTLDHHSIPVETTYEVRTAAREDYGTAGHTEVREIVRIDPGKNPGPEGVVTHRVYCLDYHLLLDDRTADANILLKTWKLLCLYLTMTRRFLFAFTALSFSRRQKLCVAVGGFWLSLVLIYAILAVGTLVRLAGEAIPPIQVSAKTADQTQVETKAKIAPAPKSEPGWVTKGWNTLTGALKLKQAGEWIGEKCFALWVACGEIWHVFGRIWDFFATKQARIIAVLGALGLSMTGLRAWLDQNVVLSLRFCRYLEMGSARMACTGRFNALLEHVLSGAPSRTDVVAYSLGSLVALDALYPTEGNPDARVTQVTSLTTIGCPFDFVRTFWDKYFDHRETKSAELVWLNIYSPVDLLGSNFANADGVQQSATLGINASARAEPKGGPKLKAADKARPTHNLFYDPMGRRELKVLDALLMQGFTAHTQYWVPGECDAESCFQCFVPKLYAAG